MHIETQFSIFLINKPGILSQVLAELAREKVNVIAMTMMDSVEHGVLRLVATGSAHIRKILRKINLQINETDVLCINLPNRPGAMADIAAKLSEGHININYCYVTAGARGGRTTGIFKVADIKKAMKILEKAGIKRKVSAKKKVPVRKTVARGAR